MKTWTWISALRLRTLALSLALVLMGGIMAYQDGHFDGIIFLFTVLTTLFLQILSNLCNDYGDAKKGVDASSESARKRKLQTGEITFFQMRAAIALMTASVICLGVTLLILVWYNISFKWIIVLAILGIFAVWAAIGYTIGKKPYGYKGLGDLYVFIFFGLIGVAGTFILNAGYIGIWQFFPAVALGFLSMGVLNVNNMRDAENDRKFGKITMAVRLGVKRCKIYHTSLLIGAMICMIIYTSFTNGGIWRWLFLLVIPILSVHLYKILKKPASTYDPQLAILSISTLLMVILYSIGVLIK